jgi:hypothetical protein
VLGGRARADQPLERVPERGPLPYGHLGNGTPHVQPRVEEQQPLQAVSVHRTLASSISAAGAGVYVLAQPLDVSVATPAGT